MTYHKNKNFFHQGDLLAIYMYFHLVLLIVLGFQAQNLFQLLVIETYFFFLF